MTADTPDYAPCYGMGYLFDSTDIHDHIEARKICGDCTLIAGCRKMTADAISLAVPGGGIEGTWAGELYRDGKVIATDSVQDALFPTREAS